MKRRVIFYRNAYYYFYYLAKALRKRGWDAISVSVDDPKSKIYQFYHGEDINLFSSDPEIFRKNIDEFYLEALERFNMVYFQGDHCLSFYPENYSKIMPDDLAEWIRRGKKIGYISSGCTSGISQKSISQWSYSDTGKICCEKCVYLNNKNVCSDYRNLSWGRKYNSLCDIVSAVYLPAADYMAGTNVYYDPIDVAMDSSLWSPDLIIPKEYIIPKKSNEILIFHAMGNFNSRTKNKINIKGTSAILKAVDKIRNEGIKCRIVFKTEVHNYELRYYQAQADIILEQLNIGRIGATSREGLMLGKPVITYLNREEPVIKSGHESMVDIPIISATEETIYNVLKNLILDRQTRIELGVKSREYALKWFDADACAERFEKVYDKIMNEGRYNNGIYNSSEYLNVEIQKDIYDYYIDLSKKGKFRSEIIINAFTHEAYFKENWSSYLEFAWLYRKVHYYIKKRKEEGICIFGELFEKALIELEFGNNDNAILLLEKAKEFYDERSSQFLGIKLENYLFLISQILLYNKEYERALEYLFNAIKINEEYTEALAFLTNLYINTNHVIEAKKMAEKAFMSEPSDKSLFDMVIYINKKLGLPGNHNSQIDEWLKKKNNEVEELISMEKLQEAKILIEKIQTFVPDSLDCINNLAVIEIMSKNINSAEDKLNYILKIDPESDIAKENLKYLNQIKFEF